MDFDEEHRAWVICNVGYSSGCHIFVNTIGARKTAQNSDIPEMY